MHYSESLVLLRSAAQTGVEVLPFFGVAMRMVDLQRRQIAVAVEMFYRVGQARGSDEVAGASGREGVGERSSARSERPLKHVPTQTRRQRLTHIDVMLFCLKTLYFDC